MLIVLLFLLLIFDRASTIRVGSIQNVSLLTSNLSTVLFNGSCQDCLCRMLNSNQTIVSFNCYEMSRTCRLFSNDLQSVRSELNDAPDTTFYFLQLPPDNYTSLFWPFDGSINDTSNLVNTIQSGTVSFISPGIYGRGSAISLNSTQFLSVSSPYLDTILDGFTFEAWIYLIWFPQSTSRDNSLIGQCFATSTSNCLQLLLRDNQTYLGFYGSDCSGTRTLFANQWYHVAFVYDAIVSQQFIFVNGQIDNSCKQRDLNRMDGVPLTIGKTLFDSTTLYHGYMDQLSYINRPKSANEISNDATLIFYFAFDDDSFLDSGPNTMIGTSYNITLVNNTLVFNNTFSSFQIETFVFPGIYNISFSIALWINPFSINNSTLIHVSNNFSCWNMIGFNDQGQLILQTPENQTLIGPKLTSHTWTHIVLVYSVNYELELYINGTFYNETQSFNSQSLAQSCTITLGTTKHYCQSYGGNVGVSYNGFIDEFRMYARELNSADIQVLLNWQINL